MSDIVPQGGWTFNMGKISLIAKSKEELIIILTQFRKSNRIPEGDIVKDIESHIEENNPGYKFSGFKMIVEK